MDAIDLQKSPYDAVGMTEEQMYDIMEKEEADADAKAEAHDLQDWDF